MTASTSAAAASLDVVIVGAGFSGLAAARALRLAGITDFLILDKASSLGGTWRDNHYPGAACDVPSHLYSFSFAPHPGWSRSYASQPEILAYMQATAASLALSAHLRFEHEVLGATFDPVRGGWHIALRHRPALFARALILGNGALSTPQVPDLPGLSSFQGPTFHSARWDHTLDLRGRHIAVVGTGASAIQFVPELQKVAAHIDLYQRTPPWVLPKPDRAYTRIEQQLFGHLPWLARAHRAWLYARHEVRAIPFLWAPSVMRAAAWQARRQLAAQVADPALRARLTPHYTMGCKRILLSNTWYGAITQPNVSVITEPIAGVTPRGLTTRDGDEHPADVLIFGTGFAVANYLSSLDIRGREAAPLDAAMAAGAETYLGLAVHGFPNLFLMMGPNTGLGHNSMIFMIEAQAHYAAQALRHLIHRRLRSVEVRASAQRRVHAELMRRFPRTVWASGCASWYLQGGVNAALWPGLTVEYWLRTRSVQLSDYTLIKA